MSLLKKVFGKSEKNEPLNRIGGVDALSNRLARVVHNSTEQFIVHYAKFHRGIPENITELETVVPTILWSFILRGFCRHAPLWSPSNPQGFVNELCLSIVRHEWPDGADADLRELMRDTLAGLVQEMGKDEKEEQLGKIEGSVVMARAGGRLLNRMRKEAPGKFPFIMDQALILDTALSVESPPFVSLSTKYLKVLGAVDGEGHYVG